MVQNEAQVREANLALAKNLLERFGRNMDGWYDNLHEDIVMEFPFGNSVGMPLRVEGKEACAGVFKTVCDVVQVQFSDIQLTSAADPARLIAEYRGYSEPNGSAYDQTYISVQEYRDGKMILFREYWNAVVVREALGDLSGL